MPQGLISASFGNYGAVYNRFGLPVGMASNYVDGTILVADSDNNRIMVFPTVE